MNLIPTNVQSQLIKMPQSSEAGAADSLAGEGSETDKFPHVLQNHISENPANNSQLIENTQLNESVEPGDNISIISLPVISAPESWLDHLAKAGVTFSGDSDLLASANTNASASYPNPGLEDSSIIYADQLLPAITSSIPVIGEVLPVGGNSLPSEVAVNAVVSSGQVLDIDQKQAVGRNILGEATLLTKSGDGIELAQRNVPNDKIELSVAAKNPVNPLPELESKSQSEKFSDSLIAKFQGSQNAHNPILDGSLSRPQPGAIVMSSVSNQPPSLTTPMDLEQLSIVKPESASEWGKGLGDRVSWMINQKLNTASIRLDPPMLGKLEVSILVRDDVTSVTINAQNAQTREMIENASFRLRDHLQEAGFQNVNVDVSNDRGQKHPGAENLADSITSDDVQLNDQDENSSDQAADHYSSDSLVDYFV